MNNQTLLFRFQHAATVLASLTCSALISAASSAFAQDVWGTPLAQSAPNTAPPPPPPPPPPAQQLEAWELEAVGGSGAPAPELANGAFQLGVQMFLVQYLNYSQTGEGNSQSAITDLDSLSWGPTSIPPVIELGYGLSGRWVLGATVAFGGNGSSHTNTASAGDNSRFKLSFGPKLDFVILPRSRISPFLGAQLTYVTGSSARSQKTSNTSEDTSDYSFDGFSAGGRVGLRCFLFDAVSLDSALALIGWSTSGEEKLPESQSNKQSGMDFGWTIGLSAWIK